MKPFHNPFGVLGAIRDSLPEAADPAGRTGVPDAGILQVGGKSAAPEDRQPPARKYPRAVVRMERRGRGGKEVTIIEQLGLSPAERPVWLAALKSALGCGGSVEGESLMLQGDHRKRLTAVLGARGVRKIIVSAP